MDYSKLDNDELLRLAINTINQDNHPESVILLKTLLERDPDHVFAIYLLAAEHAQIGMMDRAEEGFARTVALSPDFNIARFQLGQLYLLKGDVLAAKSVLNPVTKATTGGELAHYAKGLIALADENTTTAIAELQAGLTYEPEIPALAADMRRMLEGLTGSLVKSTGSEIPVAVLPAAHNLYLSGYKTDN